MTHFTKGSQVGWLGLDWGNVPGWLSAGSFVVGLGVFWRDHRLRLRKQAEELGVWGELAPVDEAEEHRIGTARIHLQNSSNRPIYVAFVHYSAVVCCVDPDAEDAFQFPRYRRLKYTEHFVEDTYVEPGGKADWSMFIHGDDDAEVFPYNGMRGVGDESVTIHGVWLADSSGRRWLISPSRGKRPKRVRFVRLYLLLWNYPYPAHDWISGLSRRFARWRFNKDHTKLHPTTIWI